MKDRVKKLSNYQYKNPIEPTKVPNLTTPIKHVGKLILKANTHAIQEFGADQLRETPQVERSSTSQLNGPVKRKILYVVREIHGWIVLSSQQNM